MDTLSTGEKQLTFLLKLSDALRPLGNPMDIEEAATNTAMDYMGADRCHYSTIEEDNVIIMRDAVRGDLPSVAGVHPISSFPLYKAVLNAGRPFVVEDVRTSNILDEDLKKLCLQSQYGSFINVPVIKNGKSVGLLSLAQSKPRKWTDSEVQLTVETAERTWAAVERAKAEEALRKSKEKYRTLFDTIDQGFSILEVLFNDTGKAVDYVFLEINNAHEAMGAVPSSVVGKRIRELIPNIEDSVIERLGKVVLTGESIRYEQYISAQGRWFDIHSSRVGGNGSHLVANVFNNITELKQSEAKLKESESRFRTMADASPVLIWTIDAGGLSSYYNKTFLDFIGVSQDEDISDWGKIVHPDDIQTTFSTINTAIADRHSYSLECRLLRADGQWRWVLAQGNPSMGDNNEFLGFVGSSVDITERKEVEAKIKESEKRFQAAIAAVEGVIWTNNAKGEMEGEQPGWAKLTGQVFEEYQGYGWAKAVHQDDAQPTMDAWNDAVKNKSTFEFEHRVKTKQDGWRLFSVKAVPAFDENGSIEQWVGVHTDITEQREATKKIKESEHYFQQLTDTVPAIIWITDPDGYCTYLNKNWYSYTGQTEEEAKGFGWLDATHPDDKEETGKIFLEANAQHKPFIASYRLKVKTGVYRWAIYMGSSKFSEDGVYEGMIGTVVDVHEEKLASEKIRDSEEQFSTLANNIQNLAWMANADGGIFWYNNRWYEYTGTTPAEMEGWGWKSVHDPEQLPLVMDRWQQSIDTGESFEMTFPLKGADNKFRSFLTRVEPMRNSEGKVIRWVGTNTDITEQKETEALLGYRKALLEAHNESSVDGILLVDAKGKILSYNQRFIEIWNMPQEIIDAKDDEAALSFAMTQLVHPQQFIDKVKYLYEHPKETTLDELDFKDGKIVERHGYPVVGEHGTYYAWSWTFRDITKQKNYEKTIIESEQRFRTLAETLPQLIWMTNEKGAYEYASSHWIDYSGLDPYEEDTWEKLVCPDDLESLRQVWASSVQTGKTYNAEVRLKNKVGAYRWHLIQGEPIKNEKGSIIKWIGAFTDIENLKEEQKQKDDFLSMASHELKTPVTTIKAYGQIIERLLEEKGDVQTLGMIKKMSKQLNRLTSLITDLLDVTKMQKGGLIRNESVFNFEELVKEVIDDMQKTIVTHQ
ncbi:MAG TPA: PAS domain S-box protein [Sphingobacteriaceae bacterium]|nr:PAS domain S-box protein [Sphingobacteriaceae bacterium]